MGYLRIKQKSHRNVRETSKFVLREAKEKTAVRRRIKISYTEIK